MRVKQICKYLERAAYYDGLAAIDPAQRPRGTVLAETAAQRAAECRQKAALLFVDGLKNRAPLADNPNARHQRAHQRRKHKGGPGRGRRGVRWGRALWVGTDESK